MKKLLNAKTKHSATRDLFAELREGIEALTEERTRKTPLRTHAVEVHDDQKHHGRWGSGLKS